MRSLLLRLNRTFLLFTNEPSFYNYTFEIFTKRHCRTPSYSFYPNHLIGKDSTAIATALNISASSKSFILGKQIHGHVIKLGFANEVFSQNNLIKMYFRCGVLSDGLKVFDKMPERNLVSWTLVISGANHNCEFELGLNTFVDMTRTGLLPNEFALASVMKACTSIMADESGLCIHCFSLKIGMENNPFVGCSILHMYVNGGAIDSAERVFARMDSRDVGSWNAMIGGYAQCGCGSEALNAVSSMHSRGLPMDEFTFINAFNGCSVVGALDFGRQIHGLIVKVGAEPSTSVMNSLMDMYFKNVEKESALKNFYAMQDKDVVSWNTIFTDSSQDADAREIVDLFLNFTLTGLKPTNVTFSILFRFCGEVQELDLGLQFYCLAFHFGFHDEARVSNSLISMFSRCGTTDFARLVFDSVPFKSINNWNEMISAYSLSCDLKALKIFSNLWTLGVEANECTFSSALEACVKTANLQVSRQIHGIVVKSGFASHEFVCSSLIKGYVSFGLPDNSFEFFNGLEKLNKSCWGAMISALVHHGYNFEAIKFLNDLKEDGEEPDEFILGSILNGCASIASHYLTKSVHSLVIKTRFEIQVFVASALVDAYAKCGDIESAKMAFNQSSRFADVALFNTMIIAYARQGLVKEAMEIFERMKSTNLKPSHATFVSVLSACSYMGLVDLGRTLFKSITLDYGMEPSPDNYGCLVDLLSRNGFLQEAKFVTEMIPFPPWPAIWRSLLNGCRLYGDRELGEHATKMLLHLFPENDEAYVLVSKVYSEDGNWEAAAKVRRKMINRGVQKELGCSWIER